MAQEWSRYYRHPTLHDLEVLHARFVAHRFALHSHDHYVIGLVESGVQAYSYRGARHVTPAGQVFLVNPAEPHTGEAATPDGYVYRTVYPRAPLMEQVAAEITGRAAPPFFTDAVIRDAELTRRLMRFHRAVADRASTLAIESHLVAALVQLIRRHGKGAGSRVHGLRERGAIRRSRAYLDEHFEADVSLAELAALVGLTPSYFARAFRRQVGLPPHAYQETVRARKARELLLGGVPIAEVALAVGYFDQSHFTNRFKRLLGVTPGQVMRSRRG